MPRIYMVRHGEPAGSFSTAMDPGLSPLGLKQAEDVARDLAQKVGTGGVNILSSPLRRAYETGQPFSRACNVEMLIDQRVAEIPSPSTEPALRGLWIKDVLAKRYGDLDIGLQAWRQSVAAALLELSRTTVIFTHFVAINAAAGVALGDDRVTLFTPGHCSVTVLDVSNGQLELVEKGREMASIVT